jgi:hypothetical protein
MPRSFLLDPLVRLRECESWDTTHVVRAAVLRNLDVAIFRLWRAQRFVTRAEVIGMLVIVRAPIDLRELKKLANRPHQDLRPGRDPTAENPKRSMTVPLPSPVSLRLDVLVRILQLEGVRTNRRRLLSSLIVHELPSSRKRLVEACDRYRDAQAGDAIVPGVPASAVLTTVRPLPGRRPLPAY